MIPQPNVEIPLIEFSTTIPNDSIHYGSITLHDFCGHQSKQDES